MEPVKQAFLNHEREESFANCPFILGKAKRTTLEMLHQNVIFPPNKDAVSSIVPFYFSWPASETRTDSWFNILCCCVCKLQCVEVVIYAVKASMPLRGKETFLDFQVYSPLNCYI